MVSRSFRNVNDPTSASALVLPSLLELGRLYQLGGIVVVVLVVSVLEVEDVDVDTVVEVTVAVDVVDVTVVMVVVVAVPVVVVLVEVVAVTVVVVSSYHHLHLEKPTFLLPTVDHIPISSRMHCASNGFPKVMWFDQVGCGPAVWDVGLHVQTLLLSQVKVGII
jgi:hypothetical protein